MSGEGVEARLGDLIAGQLACYTLPANYNQPLGNQTHEDVAVRCGPMIAAALAAEVAAMQAEAVGAALREAAEAAVSDGDDCVPWDDDHDRATVSCWLLERAERLEDA